MPRRKVQTSGAVTKAPLTVATATPDDLAARFADYPAINLITRQLAAPGDPGSLPILLDGEPDDACVNTDHQFRLKPGATKCHLCKRPARRWHVRYINTANDGRWAQIKARGYIPVRISDLKDREDVSDLVKGTADDYVRRGDTGKEVLMKRPLELHNAVKASERSARTGRIVNKKQLQSDLAEAAGSTYGDQAGSMVHGGGIQVESVTRTRTTLAEEAGVE